MPKSSLLILQICTAVASFPVAGSGCISLGSRDVAPSLEDIPSQSRARENCNTRSIVTAGNGFASWIGCFRVFPDVVREAGDSLSGRKLVHRDSVSTRDESPCSLAAESAAHLTERNLIGDRYFDLGLRLASSTIFDQNLRWHGVVFK